MPLLSRSFKTAMLLVACVNSCLSAQDSSLESHEDAVDVSVPESLIAFDANQQNFAPQFEKDLRPSNPSNYLTMDATEKFPELTEPSVPHPIDRTCVNKMVFWQSDDFVHRHLLFEEPQLERFGITHGSAASQFWRSSRLFFGRALILPMTTMRGKQFQWQAAPGGR